MEIIIKETRGRKRKYDFSNLDVGGHLIFENSNRQTVMSSAQYFLKKFSLTWKFRSWSEDNNVIIVRIK